MSPTDAHLLQALVAAALVVYWLPTLITTLSVLRRRVPPHRILVVAAQNLVAGLWPLGWVALLGGAIMRALR